MVEALKVDSLETPHLEKRQGRVQKVLIISDEHRGGKVSNFAAYQASIITKMAEYDHVVLNGDNVELFYIKNKYADDLAKLLDVVSGKGEAHWRSKVAGYKKSVHATVKNQIQGERLFLSEFMDRNPHVKIHKVLGNHENVIKFRHEMDNLQRDFKKNFEWSPEAIRMGTGFFMHGDMPMHTQKREQIDETREKLRLRVAHNEQKWQRFWTVLEKPGYQIVKTSGRRGPKKAPGFIDDHLQHWAKAGGINYVEDGITKPLTLDVLAQIRHVFTGHTHIKYDHRDKNGKVQDEGHAGMLYHNSGAVVEVTSKRDADMGILEADLNPNGTLTNIHPVEIVQDKHFIAAGGNGGRS